MTQLVIAVVTQPDRAVGQQGQLHQLWSRGIGLFARKIKWVAGQLDTEDLIVILTN